MGAAESHRTFSAMKSAERQRRPSTLLVGLVSTILGLATAVAALLWARGSPETVLLGRAGRHDAVTDGARLADCLDCHVPFVGTPSTRCLAPGCHGELATGTPPRDGPAMPVRFHAVLRDRACSTCHLEHGGEAAGAVTEPAPFRHEIIPPAPRARCGRCHAAGGQASHPRTDAVSCDLCHGLERWSGASMVHARVEAHACDLCHGPPKSEPHGSVAGRCGDCHETTSWSPRPQPPAPK